MNPKEDKLTEEVLGLDPEYRSSLAASMIRARKAARREQTMWMVSIVAVLIGLGAPLTRNSEG